MDRKERVRLAANVLKEHGPQIQLLIRRYVRDENDVEDIYQNIFLSLVRTPPSDLTFLLAYLARMVKHHTIDGIRRSSSYGNCIERYARRGCSKAFDRTPETELIQSERTQVLVTLVRSHLPPHMADVILERYVHGRDIGETATRLGIKERTVSRYACVGLKKIRQLIDQGKITKNTFS